MYGFVDEPQDSIFFDLTGYVMPASEIYLTYILDAGDSYSFCFKEVVQSRFSADRDIMMAASKDSLVTRYITQPDDTDTIDGDPGRLIYESDDWSIMQADHGEFGNFTWFTDNSSKEEYAFSGLEGDLRRLGGTFYLVNKTGIYGIKDPASGFHCDSLTRYENAKDIKLIAAHFFHAGYNFPEHGIAPIVQCDDNPSRTSILGSFIADDTLFCSLRTPDGLELAKMDSGQLISVHSFRQGTIRNIAAAQAEGRQLILLDIEAGHSMLYDISKNGNKLIDLHFNPGGLHPVQQDRFEELFSFCLENWGDLHFNDDLQLEKALGGVVIHQNLGMYINSFPPKEIFDKADQYHIDIVSKQVNSDYVMESEYWVSESNHTVPSIFFNWSCNKANLQCDMVAKRDEIAGIITKYLGPGTTPPKAKDKMSFTEWQNDKLTVDLYQNIEPEFCMNIFTQKVPGGRGGN